MNQSKDLFWLVDLVESLISHPPTLIIVKILVDRSGDTVLRNKMATNNQENIELNGNQDVSPTFEEQAQAYGAIENLFDQNIPTEEFQETNERFVTLENDPR